jgi:superoxide dismutase, Fe-Mn family
MAAAAALLPGLAFQSHATAPADKGLRLSLPELGYPKNALEPAIDALTMEIHHGRHHQAYVNGCNAALEKWGAGAPDSLEAIFAALDKVPPSLHEALRNHGGGAWNHSLFWEILTPEKGTAPSAPLLEAISRDFGSFPDFQKSFAAAASQRFGSGWAWLVVTPTGKLRVTSTPNQDNPLMISLVDQPGVPILGLDVWEHAYYLHYQNRRSDYIQAFWSVVDWRMVSRNFLAALPAD